MYPVQVVSGGVGLKWLNGQPLFLQLSHKHSETKKVNLIPPKHRFPILDEKLVFAVL
jgi:hypothetical protein